MPTEENVNAGRDGALPRAPGRLSSPSETPSAAPTSAVGRPLRVLAWPAHAGRRQNPYQHLLYADLERRGVAVEEYAWHRRLLGGCDVLHLHWPEASVGNRRWPVALVKTGLTLALAAWRRLWGTRVVWTAHNLRSHHGRNPRLERLFWTIFPRLLDGVIYLSAASRAAAFAEHPALRRVPSALVPHGHYRGHYPDTTSRAEARASLGIAADARVVAFVGNVTPYKGIGSLVEAFGGLADRDAVLLIAGLPGPRLWAERMRRELDRAALRDPRVRLLAERVPDERLQSCFRAADLVVLPFEAATSAERALNSGSALLALSFDRPILVPAIPSLEELRAAIGPDWVRTFRDRPTGDDLRAALRWAADRARGPAPLHALDWSHLARSTEAFLLDVARPRR